SPLTTHSIQSVHRELNPDLRRGGPAGKPLHHGRIRPGEPNRTSVPLGSRHLPRIQFPVGWVEHGCDTHRSPPVGIASCSTHPTNSKQGREESNPVGQRRRFWRPAELPGSTAL